MAAARTASTRTRTMPSGSCSRHVLFFGENGRALGELGPHDGSLVPALASYRFRCTGPTATGGVT